MLLVPRSSPCSPSAPKLPVSFCLCLSPYIFLERSYLLILQNLPPTSQSPSIHNSTCIVLIKSLFWNSASFVCLTYGAVIFSLFFLSFTSYVYTTQVSHNASETDFFLIVVYSYNEMLFSNKNELSSYNGLDKSHKHN